MSLSLFPCVSLSRHRMRRTARWQPTCSWIWYERENIRLHHRASLRCSGSSLLSALSLGPQMDLSLSITTNDFSPHPDSLFQFCPSPRLIRIQSVWSACDRVCVKMSGIWVTYQRQGQQGRKRQRQQWFHFLSAGLLMFLFPRLPLHLPLSLLPSFLSPSIPGLDRLQVVMEPWGIWQHWCSEDSSQQGVAARHLPHKQVSVEARHSTQTEQYREEDKSSEHRPVNGMEWQSRKEERVIIMIILIWMLLYYCFI